MNEERKYDSKCIEHYIEIGLIKELYARNIIVEREMNNSLKNIMQSIERGKDEY